MSLQLILGGAGAGKTTFVYDKIIEESMKHPEQLYFIIVPEQFTMQTQKDIVTRHPRHGTMNIDIVSFQRLAYRIFEELAVEELDVLDDMGKSMLLRKAASACRGKLVLFKDHFRKTGFISQLRTTVSEFYQYGITPDILRSLAADSKSAVLKLKLEEIAEIFQTFRDFIEGHSITTEEVLDVLCRKIPESEMIRKSVIVLDGYAGYMPVQYRLIELFMQHVKQVVVTITADRRYPVDQPLPSDHLFAMSSQVGCRLLRLAAEHQVRILPDIWIGEQMTHTSELAFLERHLFRYDGQIWKDKTDPEHLQIRQAMNPSEEIGDVIRQIQSMIHDQGYRYRDFAVVTGDLDGYHRELLHQFEKNQIPCFLDDKRTMLDHPLVEMIRAALEVVRSGFDMKSVFRYLRSGIVPAEDEKTDRMENYVLAMGIRGRKRFEESWDKPVSGMERLNLEELNQYRQEMLQPLSHFADRLNEEGRTIGTMTDAVLELMKETQVEEQILKFQDAFHEIGEFRMEKEYGQTFLRVEDLLSRLHTLLGDETASHKEFAEILDAGFSEISVGVIPATVDRVMVGDIMRTRLAHVKVLFFVGVNDGIVPSRKQGGSILTDQEREFFKQKDLELAPTAREDTFQQRFFLYRMLTKPTPKLVISNAASASDGKSRLPSYLIGELRKMYPLLPIFSADTKSDSIYTMEQAREKLVEELRVFIETPETGSEEQRRFLELFRMFASQEDTKTELQTLMNAALFTYEKQGISHAVTQVLYGKTLNGNVTRLEQYAQCAYAHFLRYGLELVERREYELNAADMGNLFHDSIDKCFHLVQREGKDWRSISDEERVAMVSKVVQEITAQYGNTILSSSARNAFLAKRVEEITQKTVWALQQQIKKGDFTPTGFELRFSAIDNLEALKISLSPEEALHLTGRVDRLDLCEDGDKIYVKIIDYKSGSTKFDLMALYYGLQLQLVVYMDAAMEMTARKHPGKEIIPAGILYYNIGDPVVKKEDLGAETPDEETIAKQVLKQLKMNGLISSDLEAIHHLDNQIKTASDVIPVVLKNDSIVEGRSSTASRERFEKLRQYVHEKVRRTGQEILCGEIGVIPYKQEQKTACTYCPYHAVCGFDRKLPGYRFWNMKKMKSEEIWEKICQ